MLIRPGVPADIPGIARVHIDVWRTTYAGRIPAAYLDDLKLEGRESLWRSNFRNPMGPIRVAVEAEEVVAFAYAGANRGKDTPFEGELYALYVVDRLHRRGVGRRLFLDCVGALRAEGRRSMVTWVLEGNPACGFYERMGGRPAGSKKFLMGGEFLTEVAYGWPDLVNADAARQR